MKLILVTTLFITALFITSCGRLGLNPDGSSITLEQEKLLPEIYGMDTLKLIRTDVTNPRAPETHSLDAYDISNTSRLMIKFSKLKEHINEPYLTDKSRVEVLINLKDTAVSNPNPTPTPTPTGSPKPDTKVAEQKKFEYPLKLCPITRKWSMYATWTHVVSNEQWKRHGGEFDESACISASTPKGLNESVLRFDVTQWFIDYPKSRDINYGLILINSGEPITIYGDQAGGQYPRFEWKKYR